MTPSYQLVKIRYEKLSSTISLVVSQLWTSDPAEASCATVSCYTVRPPQMLELGV